MEPYIEKLDQLVALKKKKGFKLTKKESEEYNSAWKELVEVDNGFSVRAEKYFYEGFVFGGAKPIVKWVLSSENRLFALDSLFKGKLFGKDTNATFRVLISTLAQLLIEKPEDRNLLCPLIKQIPSFSKNKENKTIGDAHRTVLKYFISEIDDTTMLPALSDMDLQPEYKKAFVDIFDELMNRLNVNDLSEKDARTLIAINSWLHPGAIKGDSSKNDSAQERTEFGGQNEKSLVSTIHQKQSSPCINGNPYDQLIDILNDAVSLSVNLRNSSLNSKKKCAALQETVDNLQREVEFLNTQLKVASQRESVLDEQLADRNIQITSLNQRIETLEDTIQKMSSELNGKKQEIGQRDQMIEALSRDRAKQSDEQMNRLASKLKVEYRDFRDAETLSMDCNLGENMREQLKNIFSILIKAGITLD